MSSLAVRKKKTGSRTRKISITVDEDVLRSVRQDARKGHRTLSAHITESLAHDVRRRRLQAIISEYEAEHGTITEAEMAAIRAEWQD
ncbi:MAG: ribbon-helix-helix protein, CopG family [Deltaproteobacteria bacterium]|nr:ribbon-helix-helix protein, CopG family [Deltaproteobacteria bacterium]